MEGFFFISHFWYGWENPPTDENKESEPHPGLLFSSSFLQEAPSGHSGLQGLPLQDWGMADLLAFIALSAV